MVRKQEVNHSDICGSDKGERMREKELIDVIKGLDAKSLNLLLLKRKEYCPEDSCFSNFIKAAEIQKVTPENALMGMAIKHIIAIADMSDNPSHFPVENWLERTSDIKNYMRLLEAMIIERSDRQGELNNESKI